MSDSEGLSTLSTGEVLVRLEGELDLNDASRLTRLLRQALDLSPRLIVDLTNVAFLDSTGLARLLWARNRAVNLGGTLVLVGAGPPVRRIMDLTGVADLLPLHPDIASATATVHGPPEAPIQSLNGQPRAEASDQRQIPRTGPGDRADAVPADEDAELETLRGEVSQLRNALTSRATIDQAKGIIMAERHCTPEEAFEVLVKLSQNSNVPLRDVASTLVSQQLEG